MLAGKVVCFTGTLSMKRAVATQLAIDSGATVTSSVTNATNVVVVGEGAGSKLSKAESKGIETWTETEFRQKMTREDHERRVVANKGRRIASTKGTGKFQFSLSWDDWVDLDIHLATPNGLCWFCARKISGAHLDVDRIPGDDKGTKDWKKRPIENIVCDKATPGNYLCTVNFCSGELKNVDYTVHCRVGDVDYLHIGSLKKMGDTDVVFGFRVGANGAIEAYGEGSKGKAFAVTEKKAPAPKAAPKAAPKKAKQEVVSGAGKKTSGGSKGGGKGFAGETIVFTGTLTMQRKDAEAKAAAAGAKVTGAISKKTTIVVAGPGAGSKLAQAQAQGTQVLTEAEFIARCP